MASDNTGILLGGQASGATDNKSRLSLSHKPTLTRAGEFKFRPPRRRQQCRLVNAVKSIDVDRFGPADLSACEAPDNVEQLRIIFFT